MNYWSIIQKGLANEAAFQKALHFDVQVQNYVKKVTKGINRLRLDFDLTDVFYRHDKV